MKKIIAACFLLAFIGPFAAAQNKLAIPPPLKEAVSHLGYHGYTATRVTDATVWFLNEHELDIGIQYYNGGIRSIAWFDLTPAAIDDPDAVNAFVNKINSESSLIKYYIDLSDNTIGLEAWFPGAYDKTRFAQFIKAWESDWANTSDTHHDDFVKYLN